MFFYSSERLWYLSGPVFEAFHCFIFKKLKKEIEELFLNKLSRDDMEKFEQKEMKNKRRIENTWWEWSINYIRKSIRKTVGGFKVKVVRTLGQSQLRNMVNKPCMEDRKNQSIKNTKTIWR